MKKIVRITESELINIVQNILFEQDEIEKVPDSEDDISLNVDKKRKVTKRVTNDERIFSGPNDKTWMNSPHYDKVSGILGKMKEYQRLYYDLEKKLYSFDVVDNYPINVTRLFYYRTNQFHYMGRVMIPKFLLDFDPHDLDSNKLQRVTFLIGPISEFGDDKEKILKAAKEKFMKVLKWERHNRLSKK
jgi:hypothetical protein